MVAIPADVEVCTPAFLHATECMPCKAVAELPHLGPRGSKLLNPSISSEHPWKKFLDGLGVLLAMTHENANVFCVVICDEQGSIGRVVKPETIREPGLIFSSNRTAELAVQNYMKSCMDVLIKLKRFRKDKKNGTNLADSRALLATLAYQKCWDKVRYRADKNTRLTALRNFLTYELATHRDTPFSHSLREGLTTLEGRITQLLELLSSPEIPDAEGCKRVHEICRSIRASLKDRASELYVYLRDMNIEFYHRRLLHILRKACLLTFHIDSLLNLVGEKDMEKLLTGRSPKQTWIMYTPKAGAFCADLSDGARIKDQYKKATALKREEVASPDAMWTAINTWLSGKDESTYGDLYTISGESRRVFSHNHAFEHCEGILLDYLFRNNIPFYRYIGCSKLSCYLCFTYIRALNMAFPSRKIAVRACHRKAYPKWRATKITSVYWAKIKEHFPGLMWIDMGILCKLGLHKVYPDSDSAPESEAESTRQSSPRADTQ